MSRRIEESDDGSGGPFLLGVVLGAIAGAIAGFLLSPRSGSENREKIAEAMGAPDAANKASEDLQERLGEAKEAYREGADEARARMWRELEARRKGS